jgi:hypothetical protein
MILKRQEKNGKIKAIYSSSNICASVFDTASNDLTIIFKHGGQYKYKGVSNTDYTRFEIAESQGSVLNTHIKKYSTEKLDNVDVSEILKEVEGLEAETKVEISPEQATKELLQTMTDVMSNYFKNGNITSASIKTLKENISTYESIKTKSVVVE